MILNFAEGGSSGNGTTPVNDGTYWQTRHTQVFAQTTPVTLTAAATASVVSLTNCAGNPTLSPNDLNRLGATLVVKFGGYLTTAAGRGQHHVRNLPRRIVRRDDDRDRPGRESDQDQLLR